MINRTLIATLAILVLAPAASASAKTETLRFYSKVDKATLIKADGTEVPPGPGVEPAPGDRLEIFASDFAGTFKKHAKKATASEHVVCTFTTAPGARLHRPRRDRRLDADLPRLPRHADRRLGQVPRRDRQGDLQQDDPRHQRLRRRGQDQARR